MNSENPKQDRIPLHQEVENELKRRIVSGEIPQGQKLRPELDLAKELEVSRTTIRHALIGLENQGYVERFHGRGTFAAQVATEGEKQKGKARSIYAVIPHLTNSFTGAVISGAQDVLFAKGHDLAILPTNDNIDKEKEYLKMILERGAAGVILHPTKDAYYNPLVFQLIERGIPLVMTGRHYRFVNCSYINGNNYQGAYDATKYLIDLGHKKIGLITKEILIHTSLEDRVQGYRDAMADHGLPLDRETLLLDLADSRSVYWESRNEEQGQKIIDCLVKYIENSPTMTAILAFNDMIAADVMKAAKKCGKTVGDDLSVIGFDNMALSQSLDLTTIDISMLEIGRRAAKALLKQINCEQAPLIKEHIPMQLVIRTSCKAVR